MTTDDRTVDMVEEGYDLVIRVNPDPDQSLIGRISYVIGWLSWPAPGSNSPAATRRPAVVRGSPEQVTHWDMTVPSGRARLAVDPILQLSSMMMVRDAVRAGAGVARLPISLVSHELASGALVHWGDVEGPEIALWTLYPSGAC